MTGTLWFLLVTVAGLRVGIGVSGAAWLRLPAPRLVPRPLDPHRPRILGGGGAPVRRAAGQAALRRRRLGRGGGADRGLVRGAADRARVRGGQPACCSRSSPSPPAWSSSSLVLRLVPEGAEAPRAAGRPGAVPASGPPRAAARPLSPRHPPARVLRRPGQIPRRLRVPGPDAHALRGRGQPGDVLRALLRLLAGGEPPHAPAGVGAAAGAVRRPHRPHRAAQRARGLHGADRRFRLLPGRRRRRVLARHRQPGDLQDAETPHRQPVVQGPLPAPRARSSASPRRSRWRRSSRRSPSAWPAA